MDNTATATSTSGDTITNSTDSNDNVKDVDGVGGQRLKAFIERIERLEEEKSALMEDIKEIYSEAKGTGFDAKTIRKVVALRKMDAEKRREADDLLDIYRNAIGLI
jgi:uncharacterized protein (UPF0335 family)